MTTPTDPRAAFAEEMPEFGPNAVIYGEEDIQAVLGELLTNKPAIGGEEEVTRRLRGRPGLNRTAPTGTHARVMNVRIDDHLNKLVKWHVHEVHAAKNESELVRVALTEYFDNHKVSI